MLSPFFLLLGPIPSQFYGNWNGYTEMLQPKVGRGNVKQKAKLRIVISKTKITVQMWDATNPKLYQVYESSPRKNVSFKNNTIRFWYEGVSTSTDQISEAGDFEIEHLKLKNKILTGTIYGHKFSLKKG